MNMSSLVPNLYQKLLVFLEEKEEVDWIYGGATICVLSVWMGKYSAGNTHTKLTAGAYVLDEFLLTWFQLSHKKGLGQIV